MKQEVLDIKGNKTGREIELSDAVFGIDPNDHAMYLDAKRIQANQRSGTHKSKTRGEIHGSTKKLGKQKGGGVARKGGIKNPIFRGGGRVFGPRPRDYNTKLNKKVVGLARRSALSRMAKAGFIKVVEDFKLEEPKTKSFSEILKNLVPGNKKTLLVMPEMDNNISLASRNIQRAKVMKAIDMSTYDILNTNVLLLQESAVATINDGYQKSD